MRFCLFGCKIYISPLFLLWLTALLIIDKTGQIATMLLCCLCHEAGHLLIMIMVKCPPSCIDFFPFSIDVKKPKSPLPLIFELAIHMGGITTNFAICFLGFLLFSRCKNDNLFVFSASNLGVGLFNILPVSGLDGGNFLCCLLSSTRPGSAHKICKWVSVGTLSVLFGLGGFLGIKFRNPALFLFCIYTLLMGGCFCQGRIFKSRRSDKYISEKELYN